MLNDELIQNGRFVLKNYNIIKKNSRSFHNHSNRPSPLFSYKIHQQLFNVLVETNWIWLQSIGNLIILFSRKKIKLPLKHTCLPHSRFYRLRYTLNTVLSVFFVDKFGSHLVSRGSSCLDCTALLMKAA